MKKIYLYIKMYGFMILVINWLNSYLFKVKVIKYWNIKLFDSI